MKKKYLFVALAAVLAQASAWSAGGPKASSVNIAAAMSTPSRAEALPPMENLVLGTALLLERERENFEMQQVFRLALYLRPLRRVYDPNPGLVRKGESPDIEKVYTDRVKRVLGPDMLRRIDKMNLTHADMEEYLRKHVPLYAVDWKKNPTFALVEYAVNDFHEQIAPPQTIDPKDKPDYFIPESIRQISGRNPGDGQRLFEGSCSACHGVDGQGRFPPIVLKSYLSLHSDHEHFEIVKAGPPQKPGSPIVMPTFGDKLTDDQMWAIVTYLRSWEQKWTDPKNVRRGEAEAKAAKVKFYNTAEVRKIWESKNKNVVLLDLQSDIAYRIMGHIPGTMHIRPEELDNKMKKISKDKEIIVIDMFGSQGLGPATELAKAGYKTGYLADGMMDWHIVRDYPVQY
jgi:rhodanese-related sulfurtransferase/cytochrome c553